MSPKEHVIFFGSILLSLLFWGILYSWTLGFVLFFLTNYELGNLKTAEDTLKKIRTSHISLAKFGQGYAPAFAEEERELMLLAEPARMTRQELTTIVFAHLTIIGLYAGIVLIIYQATDLSPLSPNLFNYFSFSA